jgi:sugar O-acyltransferase (sialic acid O-acetyltransferase NeuD family)
MVLGAGRGAVQVVDAIFRQREHRPVGLLDDDTSNHGKTLLGVPILGRLDEAVELHKQRKYDALIISFSNDQEARHRIYQRFSEAGIPFGNVIDPEATIHTNVMLGTGNVILANCRLGSCAAIGNNNFLSAYVNIEHHSVLGDSCTFGPGVMTSSRVVIGSHVRFGTGVFIEPGVMVGDRCVIASGSILTANVEPDSAVKSMVQTVVRRIEQPRATS